VTPNIHVLEREEHVDIGIPCAEEQLVVCENEGPVEEGIGSGCNFGVGLVDPGCDVEGRSDLGPVLCCGPCEEEIPFIACTGNQRGPIIESLDNLISKSVPCPKETPLRASTGDVDGGRLCAPKSTVTNQGKGRRNQVLFPPLLGPKCLRFAGVINNSVSALKRRRQSGSESVSSESLATSSGGGTKMRNVEGTSTIVEENEVVQQPVEHHPINEEFELSVVLPFHNLGGSDSGVRFLLNDESLKDVDGFIEARGSPTVIELEATKLLSNQQELGMNFVQGQEVLPVNRMVEMEGRDRGKLNVDQEANGFQ
jgi:hypothetical protein